MRSLLPALVLLAASVGSAHPKLTISDAVISGGGSPASLSEFGFFEGSADKPSPRLIPYELKTPLFSDYAEKQRFIYLPDGGKLQTEADGKLVFPVGTALIKSFGYKSKQGKLGIIETRILLRRIDAWVALPYVWRSDGSDADLRVGGTRVAVHFTKPGGQNMEISYAVPNKNQCKQCHSSANLIMPIGPIWQNIVFLRPQDKVALSKRASLPKSIAVGVDWQDTRFANLDQRAHAYLKVNCGHCHSPTGSASNSGLLLDGSSTELVSYGIGKRPVAAGRASGDLEYVIEPGRPDRSILISRMKSTDPGIAMPELGRAAVHDEGVALLEEWITAMRR